LKIKIDNIFNDTLLGPLVKPVKPETQPNKPFEISIVLKNTVDSINNIYKNLNKNADILKYFYNISDPNISDDKQNLFIIYPNEYTNTSLLSQKYCIEFNKNIINKLVNKEAHPLLLDNNNQSFIHNAVKSFNYDLLKSLSSTIDLKMFNSEIDFIEKELINHKNKMILNNYIDTFDNFIKTQFEEIKILILSNEANGNNILFNLHNSFKICFYIMNEYITDNLWRFYDKYNINNFNSIINKLNNLTEETKETIIIFLIGFIIILLIHLFHK
jgi:hypothetical protein